MGNGGWISNKRYIVTNDGSVKEAGPGVSGSLLVAEGGELPVELARKYGLLKGTNQTEPAKVAEPMITEGLAVSREEQIRRAREKAKERVETQEQLRAIEIQEAQDAEKKAAAEGAEGNAVGEKSSERTESSFEALDLNK